MVGQAWRVVGCLLLGNVLEVVHLVVVQHVERVLLQLGALNSACILPLDLLARPKVIHQVRDALTVHFQELLVLVPHIAAAALMESLCYKMS